jgi:hypothetical protein
MIFGQAMRHARAAVVASEEKGVEPELLHDLDLILRHGAFGILQMLWIALLPPP